MAVIFKKQPEVSLDFRQDGAGNIAIVIVDDKGEPVKDGVILRITTQGKLATPHGIDSELAMRAGIKLDSVGKIDTV